MLKLQEIPKPTEILRVARRLFGNVRARRQEPVVEALMSRAVRTCRVSDTLHRAAEELWVHDHGALPVVDQDDQLVGVITDRDICMAAYTQGRPLQAISVADAMAKNVQALRPSDPIGLARDRMRQYQLRRLPVVDPQRRVIGMISISDLARNAVREAHVIHDPAEEETLRTLCAIATPRHNGPEPVFNENSLTALPSLPPTSRSAQA